MGIADARRGNGKRFVVHVDELLTAFLKLESAIRGIFRFHAHHALLGDTAQAQKRTTKVS